MRCGGWQVADVARWLAARRPSSGFHIAGITGSVACGKTTFASALAAEMRALSPSSRIEIACTDGFLLANAVLEQGGLLGRKGFPESYDAAALTAALAHVRRGPLVLPGYSHATYDLDPALDRTIEAPDLLIVEGLGFNHCRNGLDSFIYLDAGEEDIEGWFVERFLSLCQAARTDDSSFYARFAALSDDQARAVAASVWREINLPNLRTHIAPMRALADLVVRKAADHRIAELKIAEAAR